MQAKFNNRVFVKLDSRYTDYFPEYVRYFGRYLILLKSMYGMTNSGKLFADYLTEWLLEAGLSNLNDRYLSIIFMHEMDQKLFYYLILITVSIGIQMNILENGL